MGRLGRASSASTWVPRATYLLTIWRRHMASLEHPLWQVPAWQPVAPAIPDLAREGRLVTVTVGIVRSELSSSLNYPMFLLSGETV